MSFAKVPIFGAEPFGFKPVDVIGCKVWLDAADVSKAWSVLPVDGMNGYSDYTSANDQNLAVWTDKSSGENDFIKNVNPANFGDTSSIYFGPTINAPDSYLTPLAVLNFDQGNNSGPGDDGNTSNNPRFLQQNLVAVGGYTGYSSAVGPRVGTGISATTDIFVVVKPKFLTVAGDVFSIGTRPIEEPNSPDFTSLSITNSGYWKIRSQAGARDVTSSTSEVFNRFLGDPNYRILHMSLSNNNYVLRRMGSVIGSSAAYTWSPNLADYRYYIGRANNESTAGNTFNGKIGEILVYNNIITTEKRLIVESYLAKKWNLVDLLPLDHPAHLKNIPILLRGLSLEAEPNEFTNRGTIRKIFVLIPNAPSVNALVIANSGTTLTSTWAAAGTGGIPDYYNVTIRNSTNNSTWSVVKYLPRSNLTSYIYTIGSVDDKYYQTQVEARNLGGGVTTISTSILNSVPGNPTVNNISKLEADTLYLSWSAGDGGVTLSYTIRLYMSFDNFNDNNTLIFTQTSYTGLNRTVIGVIDAGASFTELVKYRTTITAINGSGSTGEIPSSIFTYEADVGPGG